MFWSLNIEIWDLPFDFAQGGEPVEPFVIWCLGFVILLLFKSLAGMIEIWAKRI
jgi:hypothetical protein